MRRQLRQVALGRPEATAHLYDTLVRDVFAVAAVVTGMPAAAEEVTLEAFRQVAGSATSLHRDPDPVLRILSITQRLARDHVRPRPIAV